MADENGPADKPTELGDDALDGASGGEKSIFGKVADYVINEISIPASQRNDPEFRNWVPKT